MDVDQSIKDMDFKAFSRSPSNQKRVRKLLWQRRGLFKGLGKIVRIKHFIALNPGVQPVCDAVSRRSLKEEV